MTLENDIVRLRAVEPHDSQLLFSLEADPAMDEVNFATAPASRHLIDRYIASYTADLHSDGQLRLIIEARDSGKAVGSIDISDYNPRDRRGFVGIAIVEGERRKGYGRAALEILCRYAALDLGIHQLAAQVAVDNTASKALFTSCGFKPAGRLRRWIRRGRAYQDAIIFQHLFE